MHAWRGIVVGALVGAALVMPTAAAADGGAYIEFDRTHYLPGETAVGEAYVYVPRERQGLLERGPFFAFLLTNGAVIGEGAPIPDDAMRLGTFTVEPFKAKWFEMRVSFTVPDLPGDLYSVVVCNDPCTIVGFREALSGFVSVVQTVREGALLTAQQQLQGQIYSLRRTIRKDGKRYGELEDAFDANYRERSQLATQVSMLQDQLRGASPVGVDGPARPVIAPWVGVMIVLALLLLAAVLEARSGRRRHGATAAPRVRSSSMGRYGVPSVRRDPDRRAP
jgi:hypothetical protein